MLLKCSYCGIMISVSSTGSGRNNINPAVLMFPGKFATEWKTCGLCEAPYCKKCARKRSSLFRKSKCVCGGELSKKYNKMRIQKLESEVQEIMEECDKKKRHFDEYKKKGVECFSTGEYRDAVEWLGKAIDAMPENVGAGLYFIRSEACAKIGDHKLAVQDLSKAIELEPDKLFLYYGNRGISYFEIGDYASALNDFTKLIELTPDDAMAYNNRGAVYLELKNYSRARSDFEKALELNPTGEAGKLAKSNLDLIKIRKSRKVSKRR